MTREYPPEVYGGAGVHVTELVAQLRQLCEVDVHCMGAPRSGVFVAQPDPALNGANPALVTLSADLVMVNAAGVGDGRALAHLVHRAGRSPRRAAARRSPRADRAFAGADAAVEGRTARRRLPGVVVGGAHRGRGRRRRHRGQLRHARRRASHLPGAGPQPRARRAERDRHRRSGTRPSRSRATRCSPTSASTRPGRSWRSSAGSPGRRASLTSSRRRTASRRTFSWCCARARRTPPRSRPRWRRRCEQLAAVAHRRVLGAGDAADRQDSRNTFGLQRFSYARRSTSRWAS